MSEQEIYLLLTDTGSILTRTIKLFTRKKYNHISLAFDAVLEDTFSFGRKKANNPFIGGFIHEDVTSDFYSRAKCAVYALKVSEEQAKVMRAYVSSFEKDKEKYRYNLLGLVPALFNKEWERKNYYFCSHFVSSVLVKGGVMQSESITLFWSPWGSKDSGCSKIKIAKVKACCYSTFTLAIYCFMDFATNVKKKKKKRPILLK